MLRNTNSVFLDTNSVLLDMTSMLLGMNSMLLGMNSELLDMSSRLIQPKPSLQTCRSASLNLSPAYKPGGLRASKPPSLERDLSRMREA